MPYNYHAFASICDLEDLDRQGIQVCALFSVQNIVLACIHRVFFQDRLYALYFRNLSCH